MTPRFTAFRAALLASVLAIPAAHAADLQGSVPFPDAPPLPSGAVTQVPYDQLLRPGTLPEYHEPAWVTELVEAGKLPPVEERLPVEPLIADMASTPDGVGQYGGVFRHVSGGRPAGWNWMAGVIQGWGGIDITLMACLVRNGPAWMLTPERVEPLPMLATSWEWSEDGHQLTMHLLEGAKWSDGDPFDAEDIMFAWDDNIMDPNVPVWVRGGAFGEDTSLEALDPYTIRFTFKETFPVGALYQMAYQGICPGPSHILKPLHPRYNPDATYDSYIASQPADQLPVVSMGPWTAVDYVPDQYILYRRNPYYPVVDNEGNQLPYMDEMIFKLSTWEDRDIQTVAGQADFTNLENPSIYLETLRKAQEPDFPNSLAWSARSIDWHINLNLSTTCAVEDDRDMAVRELNRTLEFRRAISHAMDRETMGQSLVRGPFMHVFAGGLHTDTPFYEPDMVVYYPYDVATSKALLEQIGFTDTDGNGTVNWPDGPLAGQDLELSLTYTTERTTDPALADLVIGMLSDVGIRATAQPVPEYQSVINSCDYDIMIERGDAWYQVPILHAANLAPFAVNIPAWHRGTVEHPQELLPFEEELKDIVTQARSEPDTAAQAELWRQYNHTFNENVYNVGLVTTAAALLINKRVRNLPPGTPVLAYNWAEDGAMRERFWIAVEDQDQVPELLPGVLPGIE
jgi:peptide/nickel transport system substrate-binding protein